MDMKKLCIIGNGFDMHHQMKTNYEKFHDYVVANYPDLLEVMEQYYNIEDDSELWSEFEKGLASFDPEVLQDKFSEEGFEADYGSEDFRDRDMYAYQIAIESDLEPLENDLQEAFAKWIHSQSYPADIDSYKITLDASAFYLTFNYTTTLEDIYHIPEKQILHIHGKVGSSEKLVFGHSVKPEEWKDVIEPKREIPDGLSEEELHEYWEEESEGYSFTYDNGINAIVSFFNKIYKNTRKIISENMSFYENLADLEEITIYGHSLSEVDQPYYAELCDHIEVAKVKWIVYYYSSTEQTQFKDFVLNLGVPESLIELRSW